jgi:hypothetical protein
MIDEYGTLEDDNWQGKTAVIEKILCQCCFVHYKPHWTTLGFNLDIHGEKPVTINAQVMTQPSFFVCVHAHG